MQVKQTVGGNQLSVGASNRGVTEQKVAGQLYEYINSSMASQRVQQSDPRQCCLAYRW